MLGMGIFLDPIQIRMGFFMMEDAMLDLYTIYYQRAADVLDRILLHARESGNQTLYSSLQEIHQKLITNRFYLVVLGQFKRGKSTFINSLIGDKLLPTSIVPLTSIVTVLRFGDRPQIEVLFKDGTRKEIDRGSISDYVTEKGNPKNVKSVDHVEISYPSEYLK